MKSISLATNASWIERCTSSREPAWQLWPGGREDARDDALDGLVEVGVVEHDVRRLAAELERDGLEVARRQLVDLAAGLGAAGEADVRDVAGA